MNNKAPFETAPAVKTTANTMKPVISFKATDAFLMKSVQVNLCQKLFFLQNMGRTCCSECQTQFLYTICARPGLSLEFSCIELVIQ